MRGIEQIPFLRILKLVKYKSIENLRYNMFQDPWIDDCDKLEARLSPPTTDIDKCRLFAFKILWKKGYYITEGRIINKHLSFFISE